MLPQRWPSVKMCRHWKRADFSGLEADILCGDPPPVFRQSIQSRGHRSGLDGSRRLCWQSVRILLELILPYLFIIACPPSVICGKDGFGGGGRGGDSRFGTGLRQSGNKGIHFAQHIFFIRGEHFVPRVRQAHDARGRYASLERLGLFFGADG